MISFTTFKLLITIVYVWFAIGVAVISVFAVSELCSWFRSSEDHSSNKNIQKGHNTNYEM